MEFENELIISALFLTTIFKNALSWFLRNHVPKDRKIGVKILSG